MTRTLKVASLIGILVVLVLLVKAPDFAFGGSSRPLPDASAPGVGAAAATAAAPQAAPTGAVAPDDPAATAAGPRTIEDLQRLLEADPADVAAWSEMGVLLVQATDYARAAEAFAAALEITPDDAKIRSDMATALLYLGMVRVARAEYLRAIELDGNLPEARFNLAITYSHSAPMDLPAALREWRTVMELVPGTELAGMAQEYINAYSTDGAGEAVPAEEATEVPPTPGAE